MFPIRKSIEQAVSHALYGTESERAKALVNEAHRITAMNKEWEKEGTNLEISLDQYKAYDHFLELEPDDTELELMDEKEQIIRISMRELRTQYNLEESEGRIPLIQKLHQLKVAGFEGNSAWRNNWGKIGSRARKLKTALGDEY